MKARCVNNEDWEESLTVGKVYDILETKDNGDIVIICDDEFKNTVWKCNVDVLFALVPDEPAPKSDWMRCDKDTYINLATSLKMTFFENEVKCLRISNLENNADHFVYGTFIDSFAALVGYDWPSAGKEM